MANVKISGLPTASTPLTGAELVPVVQSGVTSQTTLSAMPYVPTGTGAVTTTVQAKLRETVSVKDFGAVGDGVTDDTAAIQAALDSFTGYFGTVLLSSNSTYKITKSLILRRGHNLVGDGSPEIVADFSPTYQTAAYWNGEYIALKFLVESGGNTELQAGFGQKSYGFRLTGYNNSTVVSYGMKFYTNQTITVTVAVNYSYLWGTIENINIRRFDTGIYMLEAWICTFMNICITYCRQGLKIEGKSVSIYFQELSIINPVLTYTSSTSNTCGVNIDSGFHYSGGVEGRPEGINFIGGLINGHYNNVLLNRGLEINFSNVGIDGSTYQSVAITNADLIAFKDCYVYTSGSDPDSACFYFNSVSAGANKRILIDGCKIYGSGTQTGFYFPASGAARQAINIVNCFGISLSRFIYAVFCPKYSSFENNIADDVSGTEMIYVQYYGDGTIIDNNICTTTSVFPLKCHPGTATTLVIGQNTSPTNATKYDGKLTLNAGQTSIVLPNNLYFGSDAYIRPVTQVVPNGNAGSWYVTEQTNWSWATFTVGSALATNLQIRYTTTAIPYSLSVTTKSATVTITIATPGVVTWTAHGLTNNQAVSFTTTGALPTGITAGTTYYVTSAATNTFQLSATIGGAAIATSGSQSGVHTCAAVL